MATDPDDRAGTMSPAVILQRCKMLTDHILRNIEYAAKRPNYQTQAQIQRLRKRRREFQNMIRPRLATVDGEAVNE